MRWSAKIPFSIIRHMYYDDIYVTYTIHSKAPHSPNLDVFIRDRRGVVPVVVVSRNALNEPRFTHASQFNILSK